MSEFAELIAIWRKNPLAYAYNVFGINEFDPWQETILREFPTNNRIAVKSGRGVGKSFLQALLTFYFLSTRPKPKVLVTASTEAQLEDVVWSECRRLLGLMKPQFRSLYEFQITSDKIFPAAFDKEMFASAKVPRPDRVESVQGFRSDQTLIIADEASALEQIVFQAMLGNLTGRDTLEQKFLMFSNPRRLTGPFYDVFNSNTSKWRLHTVSSTDSRWCSKELIEDIVEKYGTQSPEYLSDILGEFPALSINNIVTPEEFNAAVNNTMPITDSGIWGLDVARFGVDKCALAKRYGRVLAEPVMTWSGTDTMETARRVAEEYDKTPDRLKPHTIAVDTIGVGAGVYDRLSQLRIPCYPVNVATKSYSPKFRTLRDVLYFKAAEAIRTGMSLPDDRALRAQCTRIEFDFLANGMRTITTKEINNRSPDEWDAFILTFAPPERNTLPDHRPHVKLVEADLSYLGGDYGTDTLRHTPFPNTSYGGLQ